MVMMDNQIMAFEIMVQTLQDELKEARGAIKGSEYQLCRKGTVCSHGVSGNFEYHKNYHKIIK